jgi:hypothetical protein
VRIGVNCHPTHWDASELTELIKGLQDLGCFGVRFPLWLGNEDHYSRFVDLCLQKQIDVLPVLDRRSFMEAQIDAQDYQPGLQHWKGQFPQLARWQVGNEPDQPAISSWHLSKSSFIKLLNDAQAVLPDRELVAGGLVHVEFSYFDVIPAAIRHAVHPYAQSGMTVGNLLALCKRQGKAPVCTEFGSDELNEADRGPWFSNMLVALWRNGVEEAYAYCYSKRQHTKMGLVEPDGKVTNSYAAVKNAIPNIAGPPPA